MYTYVEIQSTFYISLQKRSYEERSHWLDLYKMMSPFICMTSILRMGRGTENTLKYKGGLYF